MERLQRGQILRLPRQDRVRLLLDLWQSLEDTDRDIPVDSALARRLNQRAAAHDKDPSSALTLDEFRTRSQMLKRRLAARQRKAG